MALLVGLGALSGLIGAVVAWFGRKDLALKKRILETPSTWARDVHHGYVEVKGVVQPGEVLTSPFQQEPVVFVRWKVEEHRQRGKSSTWVTVLSGTESRDFHVRDDSGSVRISISAGAPTLYLANKNTSSSGIFRSAPEHVEAFLAARGRSARGWLLNKNMRFTEETIRPAESLYVMGHAQRQGSEAVLDAAAGDMILANLTEEELTRRVGNAAVFKLVGGAIFGVGAVVMVAMGIAQLL